MRGRARHGRRGLALALERVEVAAARLHLHVGDLGATTAPNDNLKYAAESKHQRESKQSPLNHNHLVTQVDVRRMPSTNSYVQQRLLRILGALGRGLAAEKSVHGDVERKAD